MDTTPNARHVHPKVDRAQRVDYFRAGGVLKVRFEANKSEDGSTRWIDFDPANMHVWFNGVEIDGLQELTFTIKDYVPMLSITVTLADVDIDTNSLVALQAIIEGRKAEEDGE